MSRLAVRPHVNHRKTAEKLRAHPNMWQRIGAYRSTQSAKIIAARIGTATYGMQVYGPAGTFEARTEIQGDDTAVIARYIGGAE